jgi:hypothetical protein
MAAEFGEGDRAPSGQGTLRDHTDINLVVKTDRVADLFLAARVPTACFAAELQGRGIPGPWLLAAHKFPTCAHLAP